jgi:hypothetical protein
MIYICIATQQVKDNSYNNVGFQVLTAVVMKSTIFWDITQCSPLKSTDVSEEHIASIFSVKE